jgi:hypothetical protein
MQEFRRARKKPAVRRVSGSPGIALFQERTQVPFERDRDTTEQAWLHRLPHPEAAQPDRLLVDPILGCGSHEPCRRSYNCLIDPLNYREDIGKTRRSAFPLHETILYQETADSGMCWMDQMFCGSLFRFGSGGTSCMGSFRSI